MPIYEYRCDACGQEHEAIRKFSDPPLTACPACGKEALVKKVSAAGFQLKGSGWYQTDFRGGNKPAAKSDAADGKPAADGAGAPSTTSSTAESATPAAETKAAPAVATPAPAAPAAPPRPT